MDHTVSPPTSVVDKTEYQLIKAVIDSAAEAFLAVDAFHQPMVYNRNFAQLWRLAADWEKLLQQGTIIHLMAKQVKASGAFIQSARMIMTNMKIERYDVIEMKDGRMIESQIRPFRVNGIIQGRLYRFLDITQRIKAEQAMRLRDRMMETAAFAAETFLQSLQWETVISRVLEKLGKAAAVSRVYLFLTEHKPDSAHQLTLHTEWRNAEAASWNEVTPDQAAALKQLCFCLWDKPNCPSQTQFPQFRKGQPLAGQIRNFSPAVKLVFQPLHICSTAIIPIYEGKNWAGLLGLDELRSERNWLMAEIDVLKMIANALGAAIQRKTHDDRILEAKNSAERANKAKSIFLAGISHEIRNSMNAFIGLTDLTLKTSLTPKQMNFLQKSSKSAKNLLGIINDILDLSKIEAGKIQIEHIPFNLRNIFDEIAELAAESVARKTLELIIHVDRAAPLMILGDPLRIKQVLLNLTGNAVKFTDSGYILIKAAVIEIQEHQITLEFSVTDTGIGISPDNMHKLFSSFSQVNITTARKFGGTGLGLAICKYLVTMMSGTIQAQSQPGIQTVFSFQLTFDLHNLPETPPKPLPPASSVLLYSSTPILHQALEETAAFMNVKLDQAESSTALFNALNAAAKHTPYQALMIDTDSDSLHYQEILHTIHQHEHWNQLPIIFLTQADTEKKLRNTLANTINLQSHTTFTVLTKPVTFGMFGKALQHVLSWTSETIYAADDQTNILALESVPALRGIKLLVAEDDPINREVLMEILMAEGIQVTTVTDGNEAVQAVKHNQFDAVLMDIEMGETDGFTATRLIRHYETQTKHSGTDKAPIPIIAMTAHAMTGDREACLQAGMNDYITKPISPEQLFDTIARWTKCHQLNTENRQTPRPTADQKLSPALWAIPGVNLKIGINRLQGNVDSYMRLLQTFLLNYEDSIVLIRRQVKDNEYTQALKLIHKLKGAAANLSLYAISESASSMETAIKLADTPMFQQAADKAAHAFAALLKGIRHISPHHNPLTDFETENDQEPNVCDEFNIHNLFIQIDKCLAENDVEVETLMPIAKPLLSACGMDHEFKQLESQIFDFKFQEARNTVKNILNQVSNTLPQFSNKS